MTYEIQPPGPTILRLLTTPEVGNDTLWSSGTALYSSLSRYYQQYLESLSALHTGFNQAASRVGTITVPRREPIETVHPVVRVHPVTGHKAIFVNPGFVTRIIGVPKAESDNTLAFLRDGFAQQTDATVRWRWEAGDVALWDNRVTTHSATFVSVPPADVFLLTMDRTHTLPSATACASPRSRSVPSASSSTKRRRARRPSTTSRSGTLSSASRDPRATRARHLPVASATRARSGPSQPWIMRKRSKIWRSLQL